MMAGSERNIRVGDHAGLGDWVTDKNKLPDGVNGLLHTAKQHGIKFGIWIEPEMVCKQSELYEKHPDWVIHQPDRSIAYGRGGGQMVLDLSNPEVQDFVFGVVDRLMTQYPELAYQMGCEHDIGKLWFLLSFKREAISFIH